MLRLSLELCSQGLCALALATCTVPDAGVRVTSNRIERTVFCERDSRDPIRHLTRLDPPPADGGLIWIGGEYGAERCAAEGTVRSRVRFGPHVVGPAPIDLHADGSFKTMNRGGGWSDVGLLDESGRELWTFPDGDGFAAADALDGGPIGPDGALGFVVGMNGGGGLYLFDARGHELWWRPAHNVFSVAVADLDGDGRAEILNTDARSDSLQVRNPAGDVLHEWPTDLGHFSILRWPAPDSPPRVLGVDDQAVILLDPLNGAQLARYELPDGGFSHAQGALVRPAPGAPYCLAVVRTIRATWHRSAFYVFDERGQLIHHEIFDVPYLGLTAVPAGDGGAEHLLVGAGSTVWRYALAAARGS